MSLSLKNALAALTRNDRNYYILLRKKFSPILTFAKNLQSIQWKFLKSCQIIEEKNGDLLNLISRLEARLIFPGSRTMTHRYPIALHRCRRSSSSRIESRYLALQGLRCSCFSPAAAAAGWEARLIAQQEKDFKLPCAAVLRIDDEIILGLTFFVDTRKVWYMLHFFDNMKIRFFLPLRVNLNMKYIIIVDVISFLILLSHY